MIEHLDDIEADFRVFYRLEPSDIIEMSGPHFFALVHRVFVYRGVLYNLAVESSEDTPRSSKDVEYVNSTREDIRGNPALDDLVDW